MFSPNTTLWFVLVLSVIFTLIGFGFRDRNPGLVLMGVGLLATLYVVIKKAIDTFG